ncbi:MAG TPA: hypothetical protein VEQ60_18790, partial [Longimicrobium sp.]|nr:hypothetical protein [Longimicrobium sp.]
MSIHRLLTLALALAACIAAPAAAQPDARGILFAAGMTEDGDALLEPVAVLLESGFMAPPDDTGSDEIRPFNAQWMRPG